MAASSTLSCTNVDDTFGPYAGDCRGGFDFTLLFEQTILSIAPLALLLIVAPLRIWYLSRKQTKVVHSKWLPSKLVRVRFSPPPSSIQRTQLLDDGCSWSDLPHRSR